MSIRPFSDAASDSDAESDDLLTTDESADVLDVSSQTLALWRIKKIGPPYVRIRNHWVRYRRSDLVAFKQKSIVRCTA